MDTKIYIIGAGAIGKTLAVLLKLDKRNVTIIRGSVDNQAPYTEKIQVTVSGTVFEAEIEVATLSNFQELDGLVAFTNKSYGNEDLAKTFRGQAGNSPIVLLQNGLGVEKPFLDYHYPEIYRCVLFATAQSVTESHLTFKPVSVSPIGKIVGKNDNPERIAALLNSPHFQFRAEENIQPVIWTKTIANCVFNSVCPILNVDNGIFHRNDAALDIAKRIISECTEIAAGSGIILNEDQILQNLLKISKSSDGQLISTLQDINNKRQTEIDTLNFEVVRIAKNLGKEHLVSETRLLGELVKLKSDLAAKIL
jgi:2-dehydropantoate 2-reductase